MSLFNINRLLSLLLLMTLSACGSGAVVFAPTPLPPDLSPTRYEHPGGAFSLSVPRNWTVFNQNTTALASASFSLPDRTEPSLTVALVNLGEPVAPDEIGELMQAYQTLHRPDLNQYREQDRQAMGDGSWRISGVRDLAGERVQQINTFLQVEGSLFSAVDVVIPNDAASRTELQTAVNTFRINPDTQLEVSELATLSFTRSSILDVQHVAAWSNDQGVFFVTGEVSNAGTTPLSGLEVQVALVNDLGETLIESVDGVMGYAVLPGRFAPFSLRFGDGQPQESSRYILRVLDENASEPETPIIDTEQLVAVHESTFTEEGHLLVQGSVTNEGDVDVSDPVALVTVFDLEQNVIGAWFTPLAVGVLPAGDTQNFEVRVTEVGGEPVNYIVEIQGISEDE